MRSKYRTHPIFEVVLLLIVLLGVPTGDSIADEQSKPANGGFCSESAVGGLDAVRKFADNVLKYGRDVYGPKHTPLFVCTRNPLSPSGGSAGARYGFYRTSPASSRFCVH